MAIAFSPIDIEARKKLEFSSGDTVRVWSKIEDKGKYRLQAFEGLVLARKHGTSPSATFTVRKIASGVGVERIFPLYSPLVDKIEVTKKSNARRSKLYYIRDKAAKDVRRKMKAIVSGKTHVVVEGTEEVEAEPEVEETKSE
jgi:large subunit ribosomal protein L19